MSEEDVVLDGVVVLAYRCRRIPQAPSPDPGLRWEAGDAKDRPRRRTQVPAFPLPRGHWFGTATDNPEAIPATTARPTARASG